MSKGKYRIGSLEIKKGLVVIFIAAILGMATISLQNAKAYTYPLPIHGYVYDADGVTPVAGAIVRIRDINTGAWGENVTDASGYFSITLGGSGRPWTEWFENDTLFGTAIYGGKSGANVTVVNITLLNATGYLWLNITLGTPVTTKHIGEPQFTKYDYDDGAVNEGVLVTDVINVTQDVAWLKFYTWWQIEGMRPANYDLMDIYISTDGGYNWNLLKRLNPSTNPTEPDREYKYYSSSGFNTEPQWVYEEIDISAYVPCPTLVIKFVFNTNDSLYNYWEGWYIDDVVVEEFGGNIVFQDDMESGVGNWTYTGYWHLSDHRSHSSSHAWYYGIEHSYVTSFTPFNFTVEGNYTDILYNISNGSSFTGFHPYVGNFSLAELSTEDGLYWLMYYAENDTNSEPIHLQSHYADNTPPVSTYEFGGLTSTLTYKGHDYTAIKSCTPLWINASDGEGAGVEWLNYSVWWNSEEPANFTKLYEVSVHDNDDNDEDKRVGYISVDLHFTEECFHEIKWQMVDYLGHESMQHSIDIAVDTTPPNITKEIGEPKYVDEEGNLWVSCKTPIWINVTDDGCGGGVGVWKLGIKVFWNETQAPPGEEQLFTLIKEIVVVDNDENDSNPADGEISYLFHFWRDCFHEPEIWAIDYVGNNISFKERERVDCTPPYIKKEIPKIVALEQTKDGEFASIRDIIPYDGIDWNENQSFIAPWSYIDAVSVKLVGSGDDAYPTNDTWVEIWDNESNLVAKSEVKQINDYIDGWVQFHLSHRVYVNEGETYWLTVKTYADLHWYYNESNPYDGGYAIIDGVEEHACDFAFKIEYYPVYPSKTLMLLQESFEGSWLPSGWSQEEAGEWQQSNTANAGGTAPEARLNWWVIWGDYAYLDSPAVDTSSASSLYLQFKSYIDDYSGGYNCKVYVRKDATDTWHDITPWTNPISGDVGPDTYTIDITPYIGTGTQIRFEFDGDAYSINDWYIDDVEVIATKDLTFFNETISYDGLNATWVTSNATIMLYSEDEGCMGGVGLDSLLYRIKFGGEWHPVDEDDEYCGNHNITYVDGKWWYVAINETISFTKLKFHEECEHILQIRAEDYVNNVRIINQTHYVDNSPPELHVEFPEEHGFYYDEEKERQYVRAGKVFWLNLTDMPEECAVGWRDFTFYWRYEYWNFTSPEKEKHPVNESDTRYGEVVNISGILWWKVTPENASIPLVFNRECLHTIYYFYEASDWLDNSINTSDNITQIDIYVDKNEPEIYKEHPPCYTEREEIYLHTYWNPLAPVVDPMGGYHQDYREDRYIQELYPNYDEEYTITSWHDGFEPWHGGEEYDGKVLVLYRNYTTADGWVQWNYKDDVYWQAFRETLVNYDFKVDFATHVNASLLAQYDILFVLTPIMDIPDNEAQAIIEWVYDGGQLFITQNEGFTYANEITEEFGIIFNGDDVEEDINITAPDMLTRYPYLVSKVNLSTSSTMIVEEPARELGWNNESKEKCLLAINEHAGRGIIIAVGDEIWLSDLLIDDSDNWALLNNTLYRLWKHSVRQLRPCHYIDMVSYPEEEEPEWYHVDDITITLWLSNVTYVEGEPVQKYMYIEYTGGFDYIDYVMFNPVCTTWHEVWPAFSNEYHLKNWTDNGDLFLSHCDNVTLENETGESEWHVEEVTLDLIIRPIPYIQACQRINLTAKDMPDVIKRVDQYVVIEKGEENISSPDTIQVYDSISTPWPWDCQEFVPTSNAINEVRLYVDWSGDTEIIVYIRDASGTEPGDALGYASTHLAGTGKGWVSFVFDTPVSVEPGQPYYLEVHRAAGTALARWYYIDMNKYEDGNAWISGEEHGDADWAFQIISYLDNPCASDIEGRYYAYEFNGIYHPANETDNTTIYGKVVNISKYYSDAEIEAYFGGHYLWYEYNESIGVHFHEECVHILYYWAKDNVCHHTPVHKQVYYVDAYKPVVMKEHPKHGYFAPVEIDVNDTFEDEFYGYNGTFYVEDEWQDYPWENGWLPNPPGQYVYKIQNISFTITNNDMNHDLTLTLHVKEIEGDEGISLAYGENVDEKTFIWNVPAGSVKTFNVTVYDNEEFLRKGKWEWWVEISGVMQYLRAGARINLSAYDPGMCPSGIRGIYYRYEWNGSSYPQEGHPAAINGSELSDLPEIANYWWYVYNDSTGIVFNEECEHILYYFAKDWVCHNSTLHVQTYYVDASEPEVEEILPPHGAIGEATVSLQEDFEALFGDGWATVSNGNSFWMIKTNEPLFYYHTQYTSHYGRYAAFAYKTAGTADAWLILPKLTIPEDGNLTFWYRTYRGYEAAFEVCVSTMDDQTDTSAFVPIWDSGTFADTIYRRAEIDLSAYEGQDIYIAFHCYYLENDYPYGGLLIDDVWVGAIHRIDVPFEDDVEDAVEWTTQDLTIEQDSYWITVDRLPKDGEAEWNTTLPNKPAVWCGDLSLENAPNGGGRYACNWNDTLTLKNSINLSDVDPSDTIYLEFWYWIYMQSGDYVYLEASIDGENWTTLESYTGGTWPNTWAKETIDITSYVGNETVWIRFRFYSDDKYNDQYNGMFIDNISIYNSTHTFFTDVFNNLDNWIAKMLPTSHWHITDYRYHSFNHSWWCGNDATHKYYNCSDDALISMEIDLTNASYTGKQAMLMFWHKYEMYGGDYGYLEISTDDGTTWTMLASYSGSRDWVQMFYDISGYIGEKIKIRFRFYSNTHYTDEGWYIDDVKVEIREVEEPIFEDGFERTFPPTGWSEQGNYITSYYYGWERYQLPEFSYATIHGWYDYDQEEWLITPVIENLPKFSNLTIKHNLSIQDTAIHAYLYISVDGGDWQWLYTFSDTGGETVIEDISLWNYYGHDIQLAFVYDAPTSSGDSSYDEENYWAIEWVNITSFGFLRSCAPVYLEAHDLPDNECKAGVSAIYWRYVVDGIEYPGYRDGYEQNVTGIIEGWDIPGVTDPEIGNYYWYYVEDNKQGDMDSRVGYVKAEIHFPEECIHDFYYFAKDLLCHSSELHHERWYVDGTPPETELSIDWANHPWIPKNDDVWPPYVICIQDYINLTALHYGKEPCIYPYNWSNHTYYRWAWYNESSDKWEFYPTPSTRDAINGSEIVGKDNPYYDEIAYNDGYAFWLGEEPPFGGWIYWMPYTEPFNFTEGCQHILYYFSKDELCNTEEPNEWHVGVDNMAPISNITFKVSEGEVYYGSDNTTYFQNCTWLIINATDMPSNIDCQTGIWYINYTIWRWESNEAEIQLLSNEILYAMPVYIEGEEAGYIVDHIDSNSDGYWSYSDYMYINWTGAYDAIYEDGWYHVEDISFDGIWTLTVREVFGGAGEWIPIVNWTTAYEYEAPYNGDGIKYDKWYDYDGREYFRIWIHLGDLVDFPCGKYEIHWIVYDYNNRTDGEHKIDVAIDCTPPRTEKEFSEPVIEEEIAGGETIHWVTADTKIWLNATDDFIWDSGVKEIWYKFWEEEPILLWKYGDEEHNKHWFTVDEAAQAMGYDDIIDYFNEHPSLTAGIIELYHWAVDNVSHVENYQPSKQHIYVDAMPPISEVDDIVPYERTEVPFNITVVDIEDFGFEDIGPIGVCKVEVYYRYRATEYDDWSEWMLYTTYDVPYEQRLDVPNWSFAFDAPQGAGYYQFYSKAYDCLGNEEVFTGPDAECLVIADTEPPIVTKEYGMPYVEIELDGEIAHIITATTPIYINATDMPEDDYVGLDKIYYSFDGGMTWYNESYAGAHSASLTVYAGMLPEGGPYHLFYYATDLLGHESDLGKQKFFIDATAPETSIYVECTGTMPMNITVNATDNMAGVGLTTLYFRYSKDSENWTEWMEYGSSAGNYTWQFIYNPNGGYYKPGYYEFYVYAEDKVGNAKALPEETTEAEASCYVEPWPEDLNADGRVNALDLIRIINHWNETGSPGWIPEDVHEDGKIDIWDIIAVIDRWTG